jgi:hypothetical protein
VYVTLFPFLRAPEHHRIVITSVEQSDGEVDSSRSSLEIEIERRVYGQNEYVAPSNVSGLC